MIKFKTKEESMDLKFLGKGSAFYPELGNNSAFFIEKNNLFLIDCGENIFERIKKNKLLEDKEDLYVFITHTHPDHVGSLGSLIFYQYYIYGKRTKIVLANYRQKCLLKKLFSCIGVRKEHYEFLKTKDIENKFQSFSCVEFLETEHTATMHSFNIIFKTEKGIVFYSGDSMSLKNLQRYYGDKIDKIYLDAQPSSSNVEGHLRISTIESELPIELKRKVYLMHLNDKTIKEAEAKKFKIVKTIDEK